MNVCWKDLRRRGVALLFAAGWLLGCPLPGGAATLSWAADSQARRATLPTLPAEAKAGFTRLAPSVTGVLFTNELRGDLSLTNAVTHNGAGVAIGDVDGDDWPDLYFCNLQGPNRLYRNLGDWRFAPMPLGEAACAEQLSTGAVFADVDGDGDLDLLVNGIATGTRLFLNDGHGNWTEATDSGLSRTASGTSMALADIDGDGDLDLYCTHYIDVMHLADPTTRFALAREGGQWRVTKVNGEPATRPYWKDRFEALPDGRVRELPEVDGFYRNEGGGRFRAIQNEPGVLLDADGKPVGPFREWGLSVMFRDLNGDGAPDFYVCNDNASPDRCWLNNGDGTFRPLPASAFRHTSRSSMALDFADVDRDGHEDLLVLDMLARAHERRMRQLVRDLPDLAASERADEAPRFNRNMLYLGRTDGSFTEVALMAGVAATDWSWCPIFLDVDLDGFEDLLVTNGFEYDVMDQDSVDQLRGMKLTHEQRRRFRRYHPAWPTANLAFRNRGDGTFAPMSEAWGFCQVGVSNGMAVGDLDNDGDLDVVVNQLNDAAGLYRNDANAGRIAVRLKGRAPNTAGIGARLRLTGGKVPQTQEMIAGGRYLSGDQALRVFAAAPDAGASYELEVRWRNGEKTVVPVQPNTFVEVFEPEADRAGQTADAAGAWGGESPAAQPPPEPPWFADVSEALDHVHVEDDFDDWALQPLLPRRLSRLGPGLSWFDVNGDGWEDLVVSAARGGRFTVFLNEAGRSFRRVAAAAAAPNDQGAVVGWPDGQGNRSLLVAESNLDLARTVEATLAVYTATTAGADAGLERREGVVGEACPGPLALADVDGDGDLDLFIGGRYRPGRYPEPVSSAIWLNEGGTLRSSAAYSRPFTALGLVSGAAFADLDGDGDADLALAVEWGPIRVFRNDGGSFTDVTTAWGLADYPGWWTSVTVGDYDGDGRLDLAAGNWGRNSLYELNRPGPLRLIYDDTNGDGVVEIVEAWKHLGQWLPVRPRPWLARGFPDLPRRIPTHEAYGHATVEDVWGARFTQAHTVEATCLDSAVFLNRGTNFLAVPLPDEAQRAPVFAVNTGDFDGDGREDLFVSQNFFGSGFDLTRDGSGRGAWLRGNGDGTFSGVASGIVIHGEQRAAALADFNHDGRLDLAVTQNDGPTKLYANTRALPGLRVILAGPPGNPEAVGAQMRLRYADGRLGPARAVQAGAGYWSQDSAVQVLARPAQAEALWVRWPGGHEQTVALQPSQTEVRVTPP